MLILGDARYIPLKDESVQCCVTSPPYWGLRDYGIAPQVWGGNLDCVHEFEMTTLQTEVGKGNWAQGTNGRGELQSGGVDRAREPMRNKANIGSCLHCAAWYGCLGLEPTPELYVEHIVAVFREVRRVLRKDGTVWLNLGDSYNGGNKGNSGPLRPGDKQGTNIGSWSTRRRDSGTLSPTRSGGCGDLKVKDLCGIPWSVAKALQAPYYAGKIKNEMDRVWLAATIDAEGSICGFHHVRKDNGDTRTGIHLTITNCSQAMLDNAYRIWPTSRQDHNRHGKGHFGSLDTYRWIAHDVDEKSLLMRELYPYFIVKKKQCLLAYNFLELSRDAKRLGKSGEAQAVREKRSAVVHLISRLNHFQSVDIPTWCVEPPSLYELGWWLRSDIIWSKPNPMPESVTDRPTRSHEYLFLLAKSERYYFDQEAVREPNSPDTEGRYRYAFKAEGKRIEMAEMRHGKGYCTAEANEIDFQKGRNIRSVWTIATQPYSEAHFATFPEDLVKPCILAGTSHKGCCAKCGAPCERITEVSPMEIRRSNRGEKIFGNRHSTQPSGTMTKPSEIKTLGWQQPGCACETKETRACIIFDPFAGSGTVVKVAQDLGRIGIGMDLKPEYLVMAKKRTAQQGFGKLLAGTVP